MKWMLPVLALVLIAATVFNVATRNQSQTVVVPETSSRPDDSLALIENPRTSAERIVNGAKLEVIKGVTYDASYVRITYPGGDVSADRGACTDVVIRALRHSGFDLQKLIHEDMTKHFHLYPRSYGLSRPDSNIDHRRVPNQMVFMRRFALELPKSTAGGARKSWQPGDIVYWKLTPGTLDHCGIVSNVRNQNGLPLVIHNIGSAMQEDCLEKWQIIGHFRYPVGTNSS